MKITRKKGGGFLRLIAAGLGFLGVVWLVVLPRPISRPLDLSRMTQMLANARSLQHAMATMTFDTLNSGKDGLVWTSMRENGKLRPATLAELFGALTKDDAYLSESDLRKLLRASGFDVTAGPLTAERIPFRIYWVDDQSPVDQPLIVSKNWRDGKLTSEMPYGTKGFVYYTKGGGGGVKRKPTDAGDPRNFPTGRDAEGRGYRYVELK